MGFACALPIKLPLASQIHATKWPLANHDFMPLHGHLPSGTLWLAVYLLLYIDLKFLALSSSCWVSSSYQSYCEVLFSPLSSNSLGRTRDHNFSWTLAMNCFQASESSLSAISSGVKNLYVDLWSTCPFCVRILVFSPGSASILGPR